MRTFIAVLLPEDIKNKIYEIEENEIKQEGVKLVEKENLHLTLAFLGELKEERVEQVKSKISEINFKKFKIKLKGLSTFPGFLRVIYIDVESEELKKLHSEIVKKLKELNLIFDTNFYGHITIARVNKVTKDQVEKLKSKIEEKKELDLGEFEVEKIYVMSSTLTQDGPIYKIEFEKQLE